eukprot:3026008-Pyramimonas_sp.AAC.1
MVSEVEVGIINIHIILTTPKSVPGCLWAGTAARADTVAEVAAVLEALFWPLGARDQMIQKSNA